MSFNFTVKEFLLGNGTGTPTLQFYKRGFELNSGGESPSWRDIILSGNTALTLTNALANGINYLKLFGNTEQRNIPSGFTQVNYVTNTAQTLVDTGIKLDFSKNYEIELKVSGVTDSWYILQARAGSGLPISGVSGSSSCNKISLSFNGNYVVASQIYRVEGHIYYLKGTVNNGNLTLYVKDETAGTEETVTGTYTPITGQSVNIGLFGNLAGNYVETNSNVYFARIKENGNYIMDYVPCKQSTTAGFYDKATNTFKTASYLSAGADAVPSPDYPMDIVSNNGVVKVSKNLFDYRYFYDNYMVPSTSTVGRVAIKLLPNTNYTVSTNTQQSSTAAQVWTDTGSNPGAFSPVTNTNGVLIDTPRTVQSDSNGYIILAIRVGTEYEIKESDFESGNVWVQIEQGSTVTPYAPYSPNGIYTDGTVETVEITGKNLFNETWEQGAISGSLNKTYEESKTALTTRIRVVNEIYLDHTKTYTISINNPDLEFVIQVFNEQHLLYIIPNITNVWGTESITFTGAYGMAIALRYKTQADILPTEGQNAKVQLEQGSTATTYVPYFDGGSATAEALLKVGDYKDEQSVIDGGVIHRCGIKVLDGSENWTFVTGSSAPYSLVISDFDTNAPSSSVNVISTHLQGIANSASWQNYDNKITSANNAIRIGISAITTLADFKQFLADQYNAGTPVIVVYPLATATTETVTGQPLTTQAGTNVVEITQASMDNLGLEVSYKATV